MSVLLQGLAAVALLGTVLSAAEPVPEDQAAIQETLRRYTQSVNDCNEPAARAATQELWVLAPGLGTLLPARLMPKGEGCGPAEPKLELTMIARVLRYATRDVVIGDGYFRTLQLPGGDRAGRVYLTFVRTEKGWKLVNLRLHTLQFEKPYLGVPIAEKHDAAGADGWITLFDGRSTAAFTDIAGQAVPDLWRIENGALRAVAAPFGKGILTRDTYRSFELQFEWKTPIGGNSGVKYRLFYQMDSRISDGAGYEYQVVDDTGDLGAIRTPLERSGALYNQFAPKNAKPKPAGEWNSSTLLVRGRKVEHWLNGTLVMEHTAESGPPEGPVLFQHHGSDFWYRNIRIRRLD